MTSRMNPRKTYWHLQDLQRRPDEYDIGTSQLLHDDGRKFEIDVPVLPWYEDHARASFLYGEPLEAFEDPTRTTYRRYTEVQAAKEQFIDGLFSAIDATEYDSGLSDAWIDVLDGVLPVLRFPVHGLQMATAYVAHLAPSGRVVVTGAFQSANELRRLQALARRMYQLSSRRSDFGAHAREIWQDAPSWQPLRKLIERLLVTYDWSEASIALQLVIKPMFDHVFMQTLAKSAARAGDSLLGKLLYSLDSDCHWQREVTMQLMSLLTARPEQRARIEARRAHWAPAMRAAMHAILPTLDFDGTHTPEYQAELDAFCESFWSAMSLGSTATMREDGGEDGSRGRAETP